jgi:phosphate/phosphite/phosphonate ABC transporter binding protein
VGVARSVGVTQAAANVSAAAVTLVRLGAFCEKLGSALGVRVEPRQSKSYQELGREMELGQVDLAWLPPAVALALTRRRRALPVALPVRRGTAMFHSALFTRPDSELVRLDQLAGTSAAWVDPSSASGYLVIRAALRASGRHPSQLFAREHFAGSHEGVVRAVLDRGADVGATYCHREGGGLGSAGWGQSEVRVLLDYGPIPADLIAAAVTLPGATIQKLRVLLLDSAVSPFTQAACELFEAERFTRAEPSHLAPLERLLKHLDEAGGSRNSFLPPKR